MTTQPPTTMRVLVIEDDPVATVFIESTLGAATGVEVVCTAEPTHALELVQSENFDVIVTDVELPGMSGLELLDEVRSRRPGIPVAVMTAHANIEYAVRSTSSPGRRIHPQAARPRRLRREDHCARPVRAEVGHGPDAGRARRGGAPRRCRDRRRWSVVAAPLPRRQGGDPDPDPRRAWRRCR